MRSVDELQLSERQRGRHKRLRAKQIKNAERIEKRLPLERRRRREHGGPLLEFVSPLKPLDVIALLVLLAEIDQDDDGMEWAHSLLERGGYPYVESLTNLVARQRGGIEAGVNRDRATRNAQIRKKADEMLNQGIPKYELAGRLSQLIWDGETLSSRQIRRVLEVGRKNMDMR